jgi:hypothetical protein
MAEQVKKQKSELPVLPPRYYLDYFKYLLDFVKRLYGDILSDSEQHFYNSFYQLSIDEQCLYVRLINRKGPWFQVSKLSYEEITDLEKTIKSLAEKEFAWFDFSEEELPFIVSGFTKPELIQLIKLCELPSEGLNQLPKERVLAFLLNFSDKELLIRNIQEHYPVVTPGFYSDLLVFRCLFFGGEYGEMSDFVIRDLGIRKYEFFTVEDFTPKFKSRAELDQLLSVNERYLYFNQELADKPGAEIFEWFGYQFNGENFSGLAQKRYDRLVLKIGKILESEKEYDKAIKLYHTSNTPESLKRLVVVLKKTEQKDQAVEITRSLLGSNLHISEKYYHQYVHNKFLGEKGNKAETDFLNQAEVLELTNYQEDYVENQVLEHFFQQGYKGYFSENYIWRGFFAALFWDIIYDPKFRIVHQPFQRNPSDLFSADFFELRKGQFQERVQILANRKFLKKHIEKVFDEKAGTTNVFTGWEPGLPSKILDFAKYLTAKQSAAILLEIAKDPRENVTGFPDLFIYRKTEYSFIEVKSENDHLSAKQLFWQYFFREQGINSKVLRVYRK